MYVRNKFVEYYVLLCEICKDLEGQEQFQAILCLKNSIFRNIQGAINKPGQKPTVLFDDVLKIKLKSFLIHVVSSQSTVFPFNVFQQTLEIIRVFVKFDFPAGWPEIIEYLFTTFQTVAANFDSINHENIEDLYRFLTLYLEILKEQNMKKLATKRENFVRQAKLHLEHIYPLWENIDLKHWNENTIENFSENDKITFVITNLLDKWIIMIMWCGFNINDLTNKDENIYVKIIEKLVEKLSSLVSTVVNIIDKVEWKFSEKWTNLLNNFYKCLKSLIIKLSDFQYSEPIVFHTCLESYLESVLTIIAKNAYFDEKCQKASLLAIYRVFNTVVYNHTSYDTKNEEFKEITLNSVGIINTSAKFKNFQDEVKTWILKYREVFQSDTITNFLDLMVGKYLKLDLLDMWEDDPEWFIENEDDLQVYRESSITSDWSFNFLSYAICNKILEYFTEISSPWLIDLLTHIIETKQPIEKLWKIAIDENTKDLYSEDMIPILIEDAAISLVGLLPSLYNYK